MIVFDLDGTLTDDAHRHHLLPDFEAYHAQVLGDKPKWPVIRCMRALFNAGEVVQIWSGRWEKARPDTERWFLLHAPWVIDRQIPILLRPDGDKRPGADLKEAWLDEALKRSSPAVTLVFEDMNPVVAMWRRRGVMCAQVEVNDRDWHK